MSDSKSLDKIDTTVDERSVGASPGKLPLSKRILAVVWDSLDKTPEERAFIARIDCKSSKYHSKLSPANLLKFGF
jgi:ACS family pantothenate transporter-like MFS transporter